LRGGHSQTLAGETLPMEPGMTVNGVTFWHITM
jgi:hypothetical protein